MECKSVYFHRVTAGTRIKWRGDKERAIGSMHGGEYLSNSPYFSSCAQNNAVVWCIHLHAWEHVRLCLQHHADEKCYHKQALNGNCLSNSFFFQRSSLWSFREAAKQTGCRGGQGITRAGRKVSLDLTLPFLARNPAPTEWRSSWQTTSGGMA